MATPSTTAQPSRQTQANNQTPQLLVPFGRAAIEHEEPFVDVTLTPNAGTQQQGPFDVPAYGYMRHIKILVQATGGAGTAAVAQPDAPFIGLQEVALLDVNGAPIVGPFSGYDLYLANKWGAVKRIDPKQKPSYGAVAITGNFSFQLRLPIEIANRDGLGAIANQNASSTFKFRYTLNSLVGIYSTSPTTVPTVRLRAWLEAWTQPAQTDLQGNAQATMPPAHGTTMYWSKTQVTLAAGQQTVRLPRVGNYIRALIFVYRDTAGVRSTVAASWPDPAQFAFDTRILNNWNAANWQDAMAERYQLRNAIETPGGLDTSVYVQDYIHDWDGIAGEEFRDGWLPTLQSTRLELFGVFGAPGSLTIITGDVSPAGQVFL